MPRNYLSPRCHCCCRYIHEIAFVGRDVAGNVQSLTADTEYCSEFVVSGGGQHGLTVANSNEGEALGTGTKAQTVKVSFCSTAFSIGWAENACVSIFSEQGLSFLATVKALWRFSNGRDGMCFRRYASYTSQ